MMLFWSCSRLGAWHRDRVIICRKQTRVTEICYFRPIAAIVFRIDQNIAWLDVAMDDCFSLSYANLKVYLKILPVPCKVLIAKPTSNNKSNLSLISSSFPGPNVMNLDKSPC
jgi:hypothetical protein